MQKNIPFWPHPPPLWSYMLPEEMFRSRTRSEHYQKLPCVQIAMTKRLCWATAPYRWRFPWKMATLFMCSCVKPSTQPFHSILLFIKKETLNSKCVSFDAERDLN